MQVHHRTGHQPHLRPAPLVPESRPSRAARFARAQLLRLVRHRQALQRRPHHLHRHRKIQLDLGRPVARPYYWHRFFSHQPDLNFDNPAVMEEVLNAMRFWLDLGVDAPPPRRHPLPRRARRHQLREPPRDPRRHQDTSAPPSTPSTTTASSSPRPTSGPPTSAPTSATATSATWRSTSR